MDASVEAAESDARDAADGSLVDAPADASQPPPFCTGMDLFCDSFDDASLLLSPFGWTHVAGSPVVAPSATATSAPNVFRVAGASSTSGALPAGVFSRTLGFSSLDVELDVFLGVDCVSPGKTSRATLASINARISNGDEDVRFGFTTSSAAGSTPQWTLWEGGFVTATPGRWSHVSITQSSASVTVQITGADQGSVTSPGGLPPPFVSLDAAFGTPELVTDLAATCTIDFDNVRINAK